MGLMVSTRVFGGIVLFGEKDEVTIKTCNALLTTDKFEVEGEEEQEHGLDTDEPSIFVNLKPFSSLLFSITDNKNYKTVIITGEIQPDLTVTFPRQVLEILQDDSVESALKRAYLRKRCIVLLSGGEMFLAAQRRGEIKVSFSDWCKKKAEEDFQILFQAVKKRFLLFNNYQKENNLKKQLGGLFYLSNFVTTVETWLPEAETKKQTFENGVEQFKEQFLEQMTKLEGEEETKPEDMEETKEDELPAPESESKEHSQYKLASSASEIVDRNENESADCWKKMLKQNLEMIEKSVLDSVTGRAEPPSHGTTLWHRVGSLHRFQAARQVGLFLLLLILAPILLSPFVPLSQSIHKQPVSEGKRLSNLNDDLDLRRSIENKLLKTSKRFEVIEKELNDLKANKNRSEGNEKFLIISQMEEKFMQLKERFLMETANLSDEIRNNNKRQMHVWDMIQSLPVSFPLILILTLLLLFLMPVRLPVPQASLIAALLVALMVLQLLLLLVLLGV